MVVGPTYEDSLRYFREREGTIKEKALERLNERNAAPIGTQGLFEEPCDVLVPVLQKEDAPEHLRRGILEALCDIYTDAKEWLDNSKTTPVYQLNSFLRVVEITRPKELEDKVDNLFYEAVEQINEIVRDKDKEEMFYTIFSVKRAYKNFSEEKDSQVIEMLLQRKKFAAAAYRAALSAGFSKTQNYLFELWCKHYDENWPVDVLLLSLRTDNMKGSNFVKEVIQRLKEERQDIWHRVEKDIGKAVQEGKEYCKRWIC